MYRIVSEEIDKVLYTVACIMHDTFNCISLGGGEFKTSHLKFHKFKIE